MLKKTFILLIAFIAAILLGEENACLCGNITDRDTDKGLEAVNVFFKGTTLGGMSNELGCYSLTDIPPGTYELITSMMGYEHFVQTVTLKPGERRKLDIAMKPMILEYGKNVIITASRTQKLIEDVPASVDLVDEDKLNMIDPQDVSEALRDIKGLTMKSYGGLGSTQIVSLRGSSSEQVVIMIDGQKMNNVQNGQVDLSNLPSNDIEKIEIVKGASSALYGSDAVGGVINIITKKPKEKEMISVSAKALLGSFHSYSMESSADLTRDGLYIGLDYKYLNSLGDFNYIDNYGTERTRVNADIESHHFNGDIRYTLTKHEMHPEFMLKYTHQQSEKGAPGTIEPYYYYARMWDRSDNVYFKANSKFINQLNDLNFIASYYSSSNRYLNEEMIAPTDNSFGTRSFNTELQGHSVFNENVVLTYGLGQISGQMSNYQIDTSYQRMTLYAFVLNETTLMFDHSVLRSLTLSPSLRYDSNSDFRDVLSPKIGMVMNIGDTWKTGIKSNFGLSYRAPTFNDLYWPEDSYTIGNPDLEPESGVDWDLGCRLQFPVLSGLYVESVYFRNHMTNLIIWETVNGIWMPNNVDEALIHGLENELRIGLIEGYLNANMNYTYLRAINLSDNPTEYGKQLVYRPIHTFNAGINATLNAFSLMYTMNITGKRYTDRGNAEISALPAYSVSDIILTYKTHVRNTHMNVNFQVKNLFNAQYRVMKNLPMPGREFRLSFEVKLNKKTNRRRVS